MEYFAHFMYFFIKRQLEKLLDCKKSITFHSPASKLYIIKTYTRFAINFIKEDGNKLGF